MRVQLGQLLLDERSVDASRRNATLGEGTDPTKEVVTLRQADDVRAGSVVVGVVHGTADEGGRFADGG